MVLTSKFNSSPVGKRTSSPTPRVGDTPTKGSSPASRTASTTKYVNVGISYCSLTFRFINSARKSSLSPTPRPGISPRVSAVGSPRTTGATRYVSAVYDLCWWHVAHRLGFFVVEPERPLCRPLLALGFHPKSLPTLHPVHLVL